MSDKLKQFIDDNREAFDTENPDPRIIKNLKKQLTPGDSSKKITHTRILFRAAIISAVIIISAITYFSLQKNTGNNTVADRASYNNEETNSIPDTSYAKAISQFKELIGLRQAALKRVEKDQPVLYRQFTLDINTLDSAYSALKTKLTKNPNTEILLEAMIRNLQLQSDLLNRQLIIIQELKQKSKAHEKSII